MQARDYFPLGIAIGKAFCNRKQETEMMLANIQSNKHMLLMAPRRYGKSSLALHVIKISGLPYTEIDFYMARNEKVIESYLLNGVSELIGKALGPVDKITNLIKKYVQKLTPKLQIGSNGIALELTVDASSVDHATNVAEGLMLLEKLLKEKQKRAVVLLDEFQNVGFIAQGSGIEAAIRHVAQKTRYLNIIFSGSNRHFLQTMFDDNTRPLYKLCYKIELSRIAFEHYREHFLKASRLAWKEKIDLMAIEKIAALTELHPYYFNKLSDRLLSFPNPPTENGVLDTWNKLLEEEKSDAVKKISLLSSGQKTVLLHIAKGQVTNITSKQTIFELQLTSSSILAALNGLEKKDILEKINGLYHVIDPVIKFYVLKENKMV